MTEYLMSIDKKKTPKRVTGEDADKLMIVRLILMEPGLYETHPEMGVGLVSKYRYKDLDSIKANLPNAIKEQMRDYLPHIIDPQINIDYAFKGNMNCILISILSEQVQTVITVNEETRSLVSLK